VVDTLTHRPRQPKRHRRWAWIGGCGLIGLTVAALYTSFSPRTFQAVTQVYVTSSSTSNTANPYTDSLSSQLRVKSYVLLVNSASVVGPAIKMLRLDNVSVAKVAAEISADVPVDTALISITVQDRSANRARDIANATAESLIQFINHIEDPGAQGTVLVQISVVQPATAPSSAAWPRTNLDLALGLILGFSLGIAIVVLREGATDRAAEPQHESTADAEASRVPPSDASR
jgi:succinoglycan biosynthesis transport protein ExoP